MIHLNIIKKYMSGFYHETKKLTAVSFFDIKIKPL